MRRCGSGVIKNILKRKWGWIGHILRKEVSTITHQSHKGREGEDDLKNSWRRDTDTELRMMATPGKRLCEKPKLEFAGELLLMAYAM